MKKAVFTQEFEKCFTIYQQVELMKKYLEELLQQEMPDISGKVDKTIEFKDGNNYTYQGTTGWVIENDKLSYETKIHSSLLNDYNAYVNIGEDSIYLDNHYINMSLDNETFDIQCDVKDGYGITCYINDNDKSSILLNVGDHDLLLDGERGLVYDGFEVGLYRHTFILNILADNGVPNEFII